MITVLITSCRQEILERLLSHLATDPDIQVIGECIDTTELIPVRAEMLRPRLLLLDRALLRRPIAECLRLIRQKDLMVKVILLCDHISTDCVDEIMQCGVRGCLLIGDEPDAYVKAILAVDGGDIWLPRRLLA